ncbi:MAG TPA: hypothetical protein VHK28_07800, partial [Candidatus Limnocylindria bacterium]|nr:hypothetical protein [Candidatus Limnocylindria bacterium]
RRHDLAEADADRDQVVVFLRPIAHAANYRRGPLRVLGQSESTGNVGSVRQEREEPDRMG